MNKEVKEEKIVKRSRKPKVLIVEDIEDTVKPVKPKKVRTEAEIQAAKEKMQKVRASKKNTKPVE